jgi:hypothetical protein
MEEALDVLHKKELHKCRVRVRKVVLFHGFCKRILEGFEIGGFLGLRSEPGQAFDAVEFRLIQAVVRLISFSWDPRVGETAAASENRHAPRPM